MSGVVGSDRFEVDQLYDWVGGPVCCGLCCELSEGGGGGGQGDKNKGRGVLGVIQQRAQRVGCRTCIISKGSRECKLTS
jgi:hypothetical protein